MVTQTAQTAKVDGAEAPKTQTLFFEKVKEKVFQFAIRQGTLRPYLGASPEGLVGGHRIYQAHIQSSPELLLSVEISGEWHYLPLQPCEFKLVQMAVDRVAQLLNRIEELEKKIEELEEGQVEVDQ